MRPGALCSLGPPGWGRLGGGGPVVGCESQGPPLYCDFASLGAWKCVHALKQNSKQSHSERLLRYPALLYSLTQTLSEDSHGRVNAEERQGCTKAQAQG